MVAVSIAAVFSERARTIVKVCVMKWCHQQPILAHKLHKPTTSKNARILGVEEGGSRTTTTMNAPPKQHLDGPARIPESQQYVYGWGPSTLFAIRCSYYD